MKIIIVFLLLVTYFCLGKANVLRGLEEHTGEGLINSTEVEDDLEDSLQLLDELLVLSENVLNEVSEDLSEGEEIIDEEETLELPNENENENENDEEVAEGDEEDFVPLTEEELEELFGSLEEMDDDDQDDDEQDESEPVIVVDTNIKEFDDVVEDPINITVGLDTEDIEELVEPSLDDVDAQDDEEDDIEDDEDEEIMVEEDEVEPDDDEEEEETIGEDEDDDDDDNAEDESEEEEEAEPEDEFEELLSEEEGELEEEEEDEDESEGEDEMILEEGEGEFDVLTELSFIDEDILVIEDLLKENPKEPFKSELEEYLIGLREARQSLLEFIDRD